MSVAKIDNIGYGVKLADINPSKTESDLYKFNMGYCSSSRSEYLQIQGYKNISFETQNDPQSFTSYKYCFVDESGTDIGIETSISKHTWYDIPIPSGAFYIKFTLTTTSPVDRSMYYSLFT